MQVTGVAFIVLPGVASLTSTIVAASANAGEVPPGEATCTDAGFDADGVTVASSLPTVSELVPLLLRNAGSELVNWAVME
jgi:hypothetical protein